MKLFLGNLKSRWDGPYIIKELFDSSVVLITDPKIGKSFTVNRQWLKPYLEVEETLKIVDITLEEPPNLSSILGSPVRNFVS